MPPSSEKASFLFRKACEQHEVAGCASYAELLLQEAGVRNPELADRAIRLLGSACNNGSFRACYRLGVAIADGIGVEQRAEQAVPYLRYACGYKLAVACDKLAELLDSGNVGTNFSEAVSLSQFSCDKGVGASCARLSRYYEHGVGVARDVEKARELLRRACRLGAQGACEAPEKRADALR
jgi:hypothetical protein